MKSLIIFLCFVHLALSFSNCPKYSYGPTFFYLDQYNSETIDKYGLRSVSRADVTFRLWTRDQTNNFRPIYFGHLAGEDSIRVDKPFKFIIHGWTDCADADWYETIKDEYLKKDDLNVIQVDWKKPAGALYPISAGSVRDVGTFVGELIMDLNRTLHVPLENIHLIGHSLGAHISGFAGKYVADNGRTLIGRITGIDPAGPLFLLVGAAKRLSFGDASFVDIIHTDGGKFGYMNVLGHADFYPNDGSAPQPGCVLYDIIDVTSCSHTRSYWLFAESINSEGFIGNECSSYKNYKQGKCTENAVAIMGENADRNARGVFYLTTNGVDPFARNGEI